MFNVQTINCIQYSEPVVIQTRSQSRNEILYSKYTHGTLSSKTQQFPLTEKKPLVLNDRKKKKKGDRKEKLTESLQLTVKIGSQKLRINKITAETTARF